MQSIARAPLSDSETAALVSELLGADPSVVGLRHTIAERAAGNPFFAEEMVRELAERGVLRGEPGGRRATGQRSGTHGDAHSPENAAVCDHVAGRAWCADTGFDELRGLCRRM